MKHINVALFVPHEGCPQQCIFCDQRGISGRGAQLAPADIRSAVSAAGITGLVPGAKREIAFFGGSFTAIGRGYMLSLLETASKYIDGIQFTGIRISTRPDAVDEEICALLKAYGVTAVELGAQSMDDRVLAVNKRGHTAQNVADASRLLLAAGFELGLQMMTGLYGSGPQADRLTAEKMIELKPETVRIYPTVVLRSTPLAALARSGAYTPQTLDEAVAQCSALLELFHRSGIRVIRLGLHSGGGVESNYLAGPYHPAFRELCESAVYLKRARQALRDLKPEGGAATIFAAPEALSQMIGQKRANLAALKADGYECRAAARPGMQKYEVAVTGTAY